MVEKRYLHTLVGLKGQDQSLSGRASQAPPTHSCPSRMVWEREPWEEA